MLDLHELDNIEFLDLFISILQQLLQMDLTSYSIEIYEEFCLNKMILHLTMLKIVSAYLNFSKFYYLSNNKIFRKVLNLHQLIENILTNLFQQRRNLFSC
jgi:hypothetical protein